MKKEKKRKKKKEWKNEESWNEKMGDKNRKIIKEKDEEW